MEKEGKREGIVGRVGIAYGLCPALRLGLSVHSCHDNDMMTSILMFVGFKCQIARDGFVIVTGKSDDHPAV